MNGYVRETVPHILGLCNRDWELILVPNEPYAEWPTDESGSDRLARVVPAAQA